MSDLGTKRIAMAGSAANPITKGHRIFAEYLTHCGKFDRVFWLTSGSRRDKPSLIPAEDRVQMTELAFNKAWRKSQPTEFVVDTREAYRESIPTIRLLEEFKLEYPDAEITFATGVDVLVPREEYEGGCEVSHRWVEGESLMKNWTFAVLPREGYPHPKKLQKEGKIPEHFIIIDRPLSLLGDISSTEIRSRIASGKPFDNLVDHQVAEYICAHRLYQRA